MGGEIPLEQGRQIEVPLKSSFFTAIGSFRVKQLQVSEDLLTNTDARVLTSMTLNNLEPS